MSCLFFALALARELAVKNIPKPWTHKSLSLKSIELDQLNWIVFSFCSCTSQGNSCQKYMQTVNSQIGLSGIVFIFCSCTGQGTSCQKYTQTLNSQMNFSLKIDRTWLIELGFELNRFSNRSILVTLLILWTQKIIPTLFLTASASAKNKHDVIFASWRFASEEVKIILSF